MTPIMRTRPSPAMVVALVALFLALVGTASGLDGSNTVYTDDIVDGEVRGADIRSGAVNSGKVVDNSLTGADVSGLTGGDVTDGSLDGADVADGSLSATEILNESLGAADLAPGSVGGSELQAASVGSSNVVDGSLGAADLAAASVGGDEIQPMAVSGTKVLNETLTSSDIAAGAVGSSEVSDSSLTTADLSRSIPTARVTRTFPQGAASGSDTTLNFNSERYDTAGMHSTSTNLSRLTAPVTGIYMVTAQIQWQDSGSGNRVIRLVKNGATNIAQADRMETGWLDGQDITTQVRLVAGDYVEVVAYQNSGSTLNVESWPEQSPELAMTWLAPGP